MKRRLPFSVALLSLALGLPVRLWAQDPVAAAAREEAAANYQSLSAKVMRLEEQLVSAEKQLVRLTDENHRLRSELDVQKNRNENAATLERISRLQEAVRHVDEARLEDNKKVLAEISRLRAALDKVVKIASAPPPADPPTTRPTPGPGPGTAGTTARPPSDVGFEYTIRKGDTLSGIITAAREQKGLKLTRKQMEEANPGVNWDRLQVGRKIFIPTP